MAELQQKQIKNKYKTLRPPTQRILYTQPLLLEQLRVDKKIKLNTIKDSYLFILSNKQPNILFIHYDKNIIRINKILKNYTQEDNIRLQFIKLLQEPTIIHSKILTLLIVEAIYIYIFSYILNLDLTRFINNDNLNDLQSYYMADLL